MKKILSIVFLVSFAVSFYAQTPAAGVPVTLSEINTALSDTGLPVDTRNLLLIQQISKRGIDFLIDRQIEADLRSKQAGDNLIIELKNATARQYFDAAEKCGDKDTQCRTELYSKCIELLPDNGSSYFNRGIWLAEAKEYDAAILDYSKAIELDFEVLDSLYNRSVAYRDKEDYNSALADLKRYLELDERSSDAFAQRAFIYEMLENEAEAFKDYEKAIKLDPKNHYAINGRGNIYFSRENIDKAIADYSKAISIAPLVSSYYLIGRWHT